jgi:4-amino-4-deoxy-L-arabinose transferase-like glycosyltransferase
MHLFGPSAGAARMAALLASVVAATGLFAFVRRWVDASRAWTTVIVLATMPIFYGGAQYANMDMLVAGCISVAILLAAHAALSRDEGLGYQRALALAFVAAACGVLAKGLIGVVVPALVLLAWGIATRRPGKVFALLLWAPGWLLFVVVAAPWFVAMQHRFPDFTHYFFVVQHLQRFSSVGFNSPQPVWFYPVALITLTLPWSPWVVALARRRYWSRHEHSDVRVLMLVWLAVVTLFFSIPSSKLIGYILPAIPPLAFLIADASRLLDRHAEAAGSFAMRVWSGNRLRTATVLLAATTCVVAIIAAHFYQPKSLQAIGVRLQALRQPDEPVIFVGHYYYDVPFYAGLVAPVVVVDPWSPVDLAQDSWRRELVDASRFAPADAPRRLLRPDELSAALCSARASWVVGPWPPATQTSLLAAQDPTARSGSTALWHIVPSAPAVRTALNCREPGDSAK